LEFVSKILKKGKTMTTHYSSGFGKPVAHQVCVIYDPANGRVLHTHEHLTYAGASKVPESHVEAEALAVLARGGKADVSGLGVVHLQPGEYKRGVRYRVELASGRLISDSL
jgi:hypothetical protein